MEIVIDTTLENKISNRGSFVVRILCRENEDSFEEYHRSIVVLRALYLSISLAINLADCESKLSR